MSEKAKGALLVPVWHGAHWWLKICPDGRHLRKEITGWLELPAQPELFLRGAGNGLYNAHGPRNRIVVLNINGEPGLGENPGAFCALSGCDGCRQH